MTQNSEEVHTRTNLQSQNLRNSETCRTFPERFLYHLKLARHYISPNIHQQHNEKYDVGCRPI